VSRRSLVVSFLALGLLAWFLRGADLGGVWRQVTQVRGDLLVASLVSLVASFVARAIRWQYLLSPLGPTRFTVVFRTMVIGFGALGLLPVRVGDLIRPYLLAKREGLAVSSAFATVVMERVLDLVAVLGLLAIYVFVFASDVQLSAGLLRAIEVSAVIAASLVVILLVAMWVLATHPERIGTLAGAATRVVPGRLSGRVSQLATTFSTGFAAARDLHKLAMAVAWSFPVWLAIAAQAWTVTVAFGIAMPYAGTFLLQSMLVVGVAVPTPGGVGSFHEAYRLGVTTFFGASNEQAVAAALVTHAISVVPTALAGLVFMAQDGLSLGRLGALANSAREDRSAL
jgi:uncharacterized protein (TIRG00374 family)